MHELLNIKSGETITFPSDIDELIPDQYLFYIQLALKYMNGEISDIFEFKKDLFVKLVDLKVSNKMAFYTPEEQTEIWVSVAEKIDLLDTFFDIVENEDGTKKYHLHLNSFINLYPEYKGFHAQKTLLDTITVGEFIQGVENFRAIQEASKEQNYEEADICSRELFHTLYRPLAPTDTPKQLPEEIIFHVVNYFGYLLEMITTTPIKINGSWIDFSVLFPKQDDDEETSQPKDGDIGWNGMVFNVAETGVFGNVEQVNKEKLLVVLLFLYKQYTDAKEAERKNKPTN